MIDPTNWQSNVKNHPVNLTKLSQTELIQEVLSEREAILNLEEAYGLEIENQKQFITVILQTIASQYPKTFKDFSKERTGEEMTEALFS